VVIGQVQVSSVLHFDIKFAPPVIPFQNYVST